VTIHPEPWLSNCPLSDAVVQTRLAAQAIPTRRLRERSCSTLPYERCAACGYECFDDAGERARTDAIYRHHGRLAPWDMIAIRDTHSLTHIEFAERLGFGSASLERWERGGTMQNRSMDNLIRLLSNQAHKEWLDNDRARQTQTTA
jgi:putative zinc finger/helix-turn-helix YgiT family protein